jgi:hypothetical protein
MFLPYVRRERAGMIRETEKEGVGVSSLTPAGEAVEDFQILPLRGHPKPFTFPRAHRHDDTSRKRRRAADEIAPGQCCA